MSATLTSSKKLAGSIMHLVVTT